MKCGRYKVRDRRAVAASAVLPHLPCIVPRLDSIKSRILALALVATVVPALLTGWLSYRHNRRALSAKLSETLAATSGQTAREMDLWLKERLYEVRVFASSYEVSENLEALAAGRRGRALDRLAEYLRSLQERSPDYRGLVVTDPRGTVVASGTSEPAGGEPVSETVLRTLQDGEAVMGAPQWDAAIGEATMTISVPSLSTTGRVLGAMQATLGLGTLREMFARFAPRDGGDAYLVDSAGTIIAGSHARGPGPPDILPAAAAGRLRAADAATADYAGRGGEPTIGTLAPVPRSRLAVVAEVPRAVAFAEVRRLRNTTLLTLLALLVVMGGVAYVVGTLIVRPLERLTRGAARVAGGDLDVDLPVTGGGGGEVAYLTGVFNDMVTQLGESRHALEFRSATDGLTGLFNRRHMMELLEQESQRSRRHEHPFAVLMIDVDHFKEYNDAHGHLAGDQVLLRLAQVLQAAVREVDRAGRYGGEEFIVVMPETTRGEAAEVAERVRRQLGSESFTPNDRPVSLTLSIGVSAFPTDGESVEAVIGAADAALYRAKHQGRDRVVLAG